MTLPEAQYDHIKIKMYNYMNERISSHKESDKIPCQSCEPWLASGVEACNFSLATSLLLELNPDVMDSFRFEVTSVTVKIIYSYLLPKNCHQIL